jgi:DNA-binding response OmpR family regulator
VSGRGGRIFVVDDDPAMVEAVAAVLSLDGFDVDGASDSTAALRAVLRDPPALLVLDVNMPGLTGWELCEIVRRQPLTRDLPVLFLTGRGEVRDRITAMQVGGTDHLTKPFHAEELRARVRALTAPAPERGEA